MESVENIQETALREIKEEAGVAVINLLSSGYSYKFPIKDEWKSKYPNSSEYITEYVYSAQTNEIPVLSREHSEFGWFSLNQSMELLSFGNNFVWFLPIFAFCIYLLDANFPSGDTGFPSDMSMWVFFMTPFFLGVIIALGRCLAIKVVTYNQ